MFDKLCRKRMSRGLVSVPVAGGVERRAAVTAHLCWWLETNRTTTNLGAWKRTCPHVSQAHTPGAVLSVRIPPPSELLKSGAELRGV